MGGLQNYSGSPVLLGGVDTAQPVADDPAVAAAVAVLRAPLAAQALEVVGERLAQRRKAGGCCGGGCSVGLACRVAARCWAAPPLLSWHATPR